MNNITVEYWRTDDGIWLNCKCGWEKNLDFSPTVADLIQVAGEHQQVCEYVADD